MQGRLTLRKDRGWRRVLHPRTRGRPVGDFPLEQSCDANLHSAFNQVIVMGIRYGRTQYSLTQTLWLLGTD